jgi:DNA-binding XRE family transcriptional regulator
MSLVRQGCAGKISAADIETRRDMVYSDQSSQWRKGWFLHPFCHLVVKAVRGDSHPYQNSTQSLGELLTKYSIKTSLSQGALAEKLGVSMGTLKNWQMGRTKPNKRFWQELRLLFNPIIPLR